MARRAALPRGQNLTRALPVEDGSKRLSAPADGTVTILPTPRDLAVYGTTNK
jgi:hypothetical protein